MPNNENVNKIQNYFFSLFKGEKNVLYGYFSLQFYQNCVLFITVKFNLQSY